MKPLLLFAAVTALLAGCASHPAAPPTPADTRSLAAASQVYGEFVDRVRHGRYEEAASLFAADATMNNHALTSAKGPAGVEAMLQKFDGMERFGTSWATTNKDSDVLIKGPCSRSLYGEPPEKAEVWARLRQAADGRWQIASLETFTVALATEDTQPILDGGSPPGN